MKLSLSAPARAARAAFYNRPDVGALWIVPHKGAVGNDRPTLFRGNPVPVGYKKHRHPAYTGPAAFA